MRAAVVSACLSVSIRASMCAAAAAALQHVVPPEEESRGRESAFCITCSAKTLSSSDTLLPPRRGKKSVGIRTFYDVLNATSRLLSFCVCAVFFPALVSDFHTSFVVATAASRRHSKHAFCNIAMRAIQVVLLQVSHTSSIRRARERVPAMHFPSRE